MIVLPPLSIGFTDVTNVVANELDPYSGYIATMLRFNGTNGSTSFVDEGPNTLTYTANGNAQLSTSVPKYGTACGLFDGTGDYITTPWHSSFDVATGEFSIELFVRLSNNASSFILLTVGDSPNYYPYQIYFNAGTGKIHARGFNSSLGMIYDLGVSGSNPSIVLNQYYHVCLERKNNTTDSTMRLMIDGTVVHSVNIPLSTQLYNGTGYSLSLGAYSGGTFSLNGRLDAFRFTNGVARYGGTFTPPTDEYPVEITYTAWNAATGYIAGNVVFRAETQKLYESLSPTSTVDATLPEVSITMAAPLWREVGYINKYKMFDYTRNQATNSIGNLSVTLTKATRIGAVGLVGMGAVSNIKIEQYTGGSWSTLHNVSNSYVQDSETKYYATRVFGDIPPYYNTPIRITLTASSPTNTLSIAYLMLGFVEDIGKIQNGLSVDAINYSKVDRDIYGNTSMVRRRNVPRISGNTLLDPTQVDRVAALRNKLNAMPALWLGVDSVNDIYYNSLAIVGFYRTFSFALDNPVAVQTTLEIEEL